MIEAIKDDLGYLKLHRAAEVFADLADGEHRDDRLEFLAALAAEEAAATRQRRLNARLRLPHFPARHQPQPGPDQPRCRSGIAALRPSPKVS